MAIVRKEILELVEKTTKRKQCTAEFIPPELDVRNVATLFVNKTRQESAELMELAWELAEVQALSAGFDGVVLGKCKNYGFSNGALVFVGTRMETDEEFDSRINRITDDKVKTLRRKDADISRQERKDRAELARLQEKLGA